MEISSLTLGSALESLRNREFTSLDLTSAFLRRIEVLNPLINAFITLVPELSAQSAIQADSIFSHQPSNLPDLALLGLPLAIKDMFETAGVKTTAGSRFFSDSIPDEEAVAVLKLKQAGAVIMGKTNTHEIALGVTGINPHFGTVKNPWDLTRIPGGSSSGSAASVAARMCLAALGTDTGGSIRIPASLCGVVGLKPTYGRISTRGVVPLSWNLDHVGVLTLSVRDAAMLLQVLAGFDPHDPASMDVMVDDYLLHLETGVRGSLAAFGVGDYLEGCDPAVWRSLQAAESCFKDMEVQVEKVDLSWIAGMAQANSSLTQADGAAFHRERLATHPDWFGEDVLERLKTGAALSSTEYSLARHTQAEGRRRLEMLFSKYEFLILPTTPIPAPFIEGTLAVEAARQLTRFTSPFNLAGLPAISIPCGFSEDGLPLGMQIVSKHWGETRLLQAAYAYEQATPWHLRCPEWDKPLLV